MAAVARALLFAAIVCTALVMAVTAAADGEAAAIVVGLAKCGDCSSKNMKGQDAFKGIYIMMMMIICSSLINCVLSSIDRYITVVD